MEEQQRQLLQEKLLQLKTDIEAMAATAREGGATVELDQSRVGRLSRMDAMQMQQMGLQNERRRQQQIRKIEGALTRMASDNYGACFVCGEAIEMQRLMADPTLTRCIDCVDED